MSFLLPHINHYLDSYYNPLDPNGHLTVKTFNISNFKTELLKKWVSWNKNLFFPSAEIVFHYYYCPQEDNSNRNTVSDDENENHNIINNNDENDEEEVSTFIGDAKRKIKQLLLNGGSVSIRSLQVKLIIFFQKENEGEINNNNKVVLCFTSHNETNATYCAFHVQYKQEDSVSSDIKVTLSNIRLFLWKEEEDENEEVNNNNLFLFLESISTTINSCVENNVSQSDLGRDVILDELLNIENENNNNNNNNNNNDQNQNSSLERLDRIKKISVQQDVCDCRIILSAAQREMMTSLLQCFPTTNKNKKQHSIHETPKVRKMKTKTVLQVSVPSTFITVLPDVHHHNINMVGYLWNSYFTKDANHHHHNNNNYHQTFFTTKPNFVVFVSIKDVLLVNDIDKCSLYVEEGSTACHYHYCPNSNNNSETNHNTMKKEEKVCRLAVKEVSVLYHHFKNKFSTNHNHHNNNNKQNDNPISVFLGSVSGSVSETSTINNSINNSPVKRFIIFQINDPIHMDNHNNWKINAKKVLFLNLFPFVLDIIFTVFKRENVLVLKQFFTLEGKKKKENNNNKMENNNNKMESNTIELNLDALSVSIFAPRLVTDINSNINNKIEVEPSLVYTSFLNNNEIHLRKYELLFHAYSFLFHGIHVSNNNNHQKLLIKAFIVEETETMMDSSKQTIIESHNNDNSDSYFLTIHNHNNKNHYEVNVSRLCIFHKFPFVTDNFVFCVKHYAMRLFSYRNNNNNKDYTNYNNNEDDDNENKMLFSVYLKDVVLLHQSASIAVRHNNQYNDNKNDYVAVLFPMMKFSNNNDNNDIQVRSRTIFCFVGKQLKEKDISLFLNNNDDKKYFLTLTEQLKFKPFLEIVNEENNSNILLSLTDSKIIKVPLVKLNFTFLSDENSILWTFISIVKRLSVTCNYELQFFAFNKIKNSHRNQNSTKKTIFVNQRDILFYNPFYYLQEYNHTIPIPNKISIVSQKFISTYNDNNNNIHNNNNNGNSGYHLRHNSAIDSTSTRDNESEGVGSCEWHSMHSGPSNAIRTESNNNNNNDMVMNYATHIHTLLQTNWIDVVRQNNDNIHNNNNDLVMKEKEEEEESEWVFYTREEDTLLHDDNDNNTFDLSSECHRGAFYLSSLLLQHQKNNNHHTNTMKEEDRILWEVELTSASLRVMFLNKETTDNNNNPKIERLYQEFILEENSNNTEEEDITHHNNNKKEEDGEKIDLIVGLEGITLRLTEYAHRPRRLCMTLKELYCYTFTAETEQTAVTVTPNPQSPEKKKSTSTSLFSTKTALSFAKSFTTSVVKSAVKHTVTTNLDSFLQQQSANKKRVQYRRSYLLSLCETSPTDWRDYSGGTRMIIEWRTPLQQEVDRLTALSAYLNGAPSLSLWLTLQPVHLQFDGNHATHLLSFLTRVKRALYHAVAPDGILEDLFLPPPLYFDTVHLAPTTLYLTTSLSGSESIVEQLPLFFSASYTELEDTNHQKSWWSASLQTALAAASTMPCQLRNLSIKVPSVTCVHTDSTRLAEVFLERLKSTTASVQSLLWSHFGGDVMPLSQRALDRSIDLAAQQYRRAAEYWKSKPQQQ